MSANTFTEAVQLQTTIMLNIAKRLDERGWAVMVHNLNRDGTNERYMYNYIGGGLPRFLDAWAAHKWGAGPLAKRRRPIIVHIHPNPVDYGAHGALFEKPETWTQHPFGFTCSIPNRTHFKSIHATLDLMSSKQKKRWMIHEKTGQGALHRVGTVSGKDRTDRVEYQGTNKDALECLIRVLDMPQHREILLNC